MRERCDVAIVGCGPVGLTLAILLGQRGHRVGVFEKQPAPYPLPRAVHFDHEIARILQAAGIGPRLAGRTEPADAYEWRNAAGEVLLCFTSRELGLSGWPDGNMFAQPELEALLEERVRSLPSIRIVRGAEAVGIDVAAEGATLHLALQDGRRIAAEARFVVGCDGANSFVRPHLGATVTDLGFFFDWLIVDLVPREPKRWSPVNIQICDPARPTTLVSGGPGRRRWEFMRLPGETLDELNSEATAWRLLEPWGVGATNATLERHAVYRFQARWVDTWRRGSLLLAGDAAHQMPPFAGQGMCSGLRDAANLAWKLDLVLAGRAPDALLDTYASERVPHVRGMIEFSMALGKVICIADPAEAAQRDAAMIAARRAGQQGAQPPPLGIGPGIALEGSRHARQLFVQGRVRRGTTTGLLDDVVGGGFLLLGRTEDPGLHLGEEQRAFLASIGGRTACLGPAGCLEDVDGTYRRWFEEAGVELALQRPDFYLYGSAGWASGAGELVDCLRAALSGAAPC
jgi:2-polyprenyl-6-methoxyphenol hydroxylase-like FAD-dependent oxidoreductase